MVIHRVGQERDLSAHISVPPMFAAGIEVPRSHLGRTQLDAETAYQIVHDEAMLDGNARMNLATFVGTWMDDYANRLYAQAFDKNMIDKDEYPQTAAIEERCVRIVANLWNAPGETLGTSTIGSSEACMLAGLAFKRRWQQEREAAGKSTDKPNLVVSSTVQVVWEKFCNYWEVEAKYVPVKVGQMEMTPEGMLEAIDENTIGVVGILGVTYTGSYEPIAEMAAALDDLQNRTGRDVPLHVDGASGGMVAPFLQPDLVWDFRLSRVHSINTSGHKYGLVYPGLGWIVWRSPDLVPPDLIFHVSYLGGDMPTLGLNFSRPGAQVLLQYYLFLRLGHEGYRRTHSDCRRIALKLSSGIAAMAPFELLSDGSDIPVFAWKIKTGYTDKWKLQDLSQLLRVRGWQVPAYPMPDDLSDEWVMRIVVRAGMSEDLANILLNDISFSIDYLDKLTVPLPDAIEQLKGTSYSH